MDKKSKVLLWVFGLLIASSVGVTFWRIMIQKDYIIEAEADCDPSMETCFIYECDAEFEECTGDPAEDISYYKLVKRNAANIPLCDPADENCEALVCPEGEDECEIILCDDETKEEDQICNDPEQYVLDNPVEDEEVIECEDGDEECVPVLEEEASDCDPVLDPTCAEEVSVEEGNEEQSDAATETLPAEEAGAVVNL